MLYSDYLDLKESQRKKIDVKVVDVVNYDYSKDDLWNKLNKLSTTAYKNLKKREFTLRNK